VISTKAFKWVSGITAIGTASTTTFSVGVSDYYGLPMLATARPYLEAYFSNQDASNPAYTATVTFSAGSAVTATTSSDVRGTIGLSAVAASDGGKKLIMWQSVSPSNLTASGLFGVIPA